MVFYRKYRPQKISELDSEAVRASLYSILGSKNNVHALLFSGPKGLGKTSAARIVAKVINCEKHKGLKFKSEKDIEPCNKCLQCISITEGTNFDVLEIDGASNRGIDEIRDLKEKINLLPSKAEKKVYIIDEVHMLTTEAFNALLKTLEEPPEHAIFILCTTEFQKLPQTIVSRCFRVDFKKATPQEFARSLKRIVKSEEIKIDDDVLYSIAAVSDGSFRDAVKILEELSLFAGKKQINKKFLEEKYNILGIESSLQEFTDALFQKDTKKGFEVISKLNSSGVDFKLFIERLLENFHTLLIDSLSKESAFQTKEIKKIIELLSKAYLDTKYSFLPNLPLEIMVIEWNSKTDEKIDTVVQDPSGESNNAKILAIKSEDFFENFTREVKEQNNLLAGVLRSCFADKVLNGKLEIVARSKFHKEKLEENKSMIILQEVAAKLTGKKVKVSIILRG